MGLDAYVTCRCWQDGKTTPPSPAVWNNEEQMAEPATDLHGAALHAFWDWRNHGCDHEGQEAVTERIGNWSGVRAFSRYLDRQPVTYAPVFTQEWERRSGNDGVIPLEYSSVILGELDELDRHGVPVEGEEWLTGYATEVIAAFRRLFTASVELQHPVAWS